VSEKLLKNLKFSDLYMRLISAIIMIIVASLCISLENFSYSLLLLFLSAIIFYETNILLGSGERILNVIFLIVSVIICFGAFLFYDFVWEYVLLIIPVIVLSFYSATNRTLSFFTGIIVISAL